MAGELAVPRWGLPALRFHDGTTSLALFHGCLYPLTDDESDADLYDVWVRGTRAFLSCVLREADTLYHLHDGVGAAVDYELFFPLLVAVRN